jgi:hypothetical protein
MAVRDGQALSFLVFRSAGSNGMIQSMKRFISLLVSCSVCSMMAVFAGDKASLNQAIESLNARAKIGADKKLVLKAVSQQTGLPEKTLQSQMSATHLAYGELLTANSIVEGSGKSLNAILAMKGAKSWTSLAKQLRVDPVSIVDRLRNAERTVQSGRAGLRAQDPQAARGDRRGSDYGPQAGGPVGESSSMRGPR